MMNPIAPRYDNRNRMTGLTNNRPGGIISQYAYTLDGVGNRINVSFQEPLSWTPSLVGVGYNYLPGNFLTAAGAVTYNYDANGNLYTRTQGGNTTTYSFDSQDRLTGISSPSLNIQYQYDGLFNRVSKTDGGTATKYLVDPNGFLPQIIAEMDGAYNITSYYVYDGIGLVAKMSGSNVYYYHYDGSGNTIAMTDSSGNMVNKYAYDEFGNLMNAVETVPNPFLYVGQYGVMDDDNGLLYTRARYYDPQAGRLINKDPIRYSGGLNLFTYVANNPINKADPLGLADTSACPKKSCWERYWEEFERNRVPGASLFGLPTSLISGSLTALLTAGPIVGEKVAQNAATGAFESQRLTGSSIYLKNYFPSFFSWGTAARLAGEVSLAGTVFFVSADVGTLVYTGATFDCKD